MAKLHIAVPFLLAFSILAAGCDNQTSQSSTGAANRVVRVTTVELTPHNVNIERELTAARQPIAGPRYAQKLVVFLRNVASLRALRSRKETCSIG